MENFQPRNYRVDNVELNYAKLDAPVSPFGTPQYELQIATTDKTVADEWKANHLPVKTKKPKVPAKYVVGLKRKAIKADGSDNGAPDVVEADATPMSAARIKKLGNGSIGNVFIYQMYYEVAGRSGISSSLTSIQVAKYDEYKGSATFEPIANIDSDSAPAAAFAPISDEPAVATANPF